MMWAFNAFNLVFTIRKKWIAAVYRTDPKLPNSRGLPPLQTVG